MFIRALYYAAGKEETYKVWNSDNIYVELHAYPEKGKFAIVNNSNIEQTAKIYDGQGEGRDVTLAASEIRWEEII